MLQYFYDMCHETSPTRAIEVGEAVAARCLACVLNDLAVGLRARVARCLWKCRVKEQLRFQSACDMSVYASLAEISQSGVVQGTAVRSKTQI